MTHARRQFFRGCVVGCLAVILAACAGEYQQTTFEPVSEFGRSLNRLFAITFWWTIGILVLVEIVILINIFRFRERAGQPKPKQIHGNVKLEFLWTVIPAIIVLFIAIPTIQTVFATQQRAPADALVVEVIGHQWWWEFRYPETGVVTANELVLPAGRNIDLKMHSADVVHSFWVPRVGGKRDVNPQPRPGRGESGLRSNHLTFNIEQPGYYLGQCAEFCGASHAIMRMAINAVPADQFSQWTASMGGRAQPGVTPPALPAEQTETQEAAAARARADSLARQRDTVSTADTLRPPVPTTPLQGPATPAGPQSEVERGQRLFTSKVCIACHTIQGTSARGVLGPNLTRFGSRRYVGAGARFNTLENVIAWITNPGAVKPGTLMPGAQNPGGGMPPTGLTNEEVRAIAIYLLSLK
ncbi:MAG TPA: cytochrome c oxidase subunit II [Longimicrobiales bacterium]|nr:cytochrome c oxidase subunit II [Longimicrobiales bacterium]